MLQQPLAVFLVLALLVGALWWLKQQGLATLNFRAEMGPSKRRRKERRMRAVERLVLTQQHSLHLISIEGRMVLFSAGPQGCRAVDPRMWADAVAPEASGESTPVEQNPLQHERAAPTFETAGVPPETAVSC